MAGSLRVLATHCEVSTGVRTDRSGIPALRQVLSGLAEAASFRAPRRRSRGASGASTALRKAVLADVPAFSDSRNPEVLPGLNAHIEEHIQEIRRLFGGGEVEEFAFLKAHAHRRAEQRFPLDATLHAYRCGQKILGSWLRDAAWREALETSKSPYRRSPISPSSTRI